MAVEKGDIGVLLTAVAVGYIFSRGIFQAHFIALLPEGFRSIVVQAELRGGGDIRHADFFGVALDFGQLEHGGGGIGISRPTRIAAEVNHAVHIGKIDETVLFADCGERAGESTRVECVVPLPLGQTGIGTESRIAVPAEVFIFFSAAHLPRHEPVVIVAGVEQPEIPDLLDGTEAFGSLCGVARLIQRGQQHSGENCDDVY